MALALLLLTTASLKAYGLGTSTLPVAGVVGMGWVQVVTAEWEFLLAIWLLLDPRSRSAWWATTLTFAAFAVVSGSLGWSGVTSCGCFGAVKTHPWLAFGIDVAALGGLLWLRLCGQGDHVTGARGGAEIVRPLLAGVAAVLVSAGLGAWWYGSPAAVLARLRGEALSTSDSVDFGRLVPGVEVERTAVIHNWTTAPVRLIGGTTTCSYRTTVDFPMVLEPGQTGEFTVRVRVPEGTASGLLTQTVEVWTDCDRQRVVRCRVVGTVD